MSINTHDYYQIAIFEDKNDYEQWFSNNKENWTRKGKNEGIRFDTEYFYCRYARRQCNKCPVFLKSELNKEIGKIRILQKGEHQHDQPSTSGFTNDERSFMLERNKMTAGQIQDAFLVFFCLNKASHFVIN